MMEEVYCTCGHRKIDHREFGEGSCGVGDCDCTKFRKQHPDHNRCAKCHHPRHRHGDQKGCEKILEDGSMCGCIAFVDESDEPSGIKMGHQTLTAEDFKTMTLTDSQTIKFGSGDHIEPYKVSVGDHSDYGTVWHVLEECPAAGGSVKRPIAVFYIEGVAERLANTLNRRADAIYQAVREYQKVVGGSVAEILELVRAHAENLPEVEFYYDTADHWLGGATFVPFEKEGDDDGVDPYDSIRWKDPMKVRKLEGKDDAE